MPGNVQTKPKREDQMDVLELLKGNEMTQTCCTGKGTKFQNDFVWELGPEAISYRTGAGYRRNPDEIGFPKNISFQKETRITTAKNPSGWKTLNPKHRGHLVNSDRN